MKTRFRVYETDGWFWSCIGKFKTRREAVEFASDLYPDAWWSGNAAWMTEDEAEEGDMDEAILEIREIVDMEGTP
jgi:hypothetical protein